MENTKLLYLEDFNLLDVPASVVNFSQEGGQNILVLDQTIFYPQGGGQPYDLGYMEAEKSRFVVEEVRFVNGIVKHIGHFDGGSFGKGTAVTCHVDKDRRVLNSRLHSAGHIVDMAVNRLGYEWIPVKGYHYPDGPYVEYSGEFALGENQAIKGKIEELCNKFVGEGAETKLLFMGKDEMHKVCRHVPDYIPKDKPSRVVMYGNFGVPCGGTHVNNLGEVGKITIRKIKCKDGVVKIGYGI